jgi:hypothetical protein
MTENILCGKHDKIYTQEKPCPGCETEKQKDVGGGEPEKKEEAEPPEKWLDRVEREVVAHLPRGRKSK